MADPADLETRKEVRMCFLVLVYQRKVAHFQILRKRTTVGLASGDVHVGVAEE